MHIHSPAHLLCVGLNSAYRLLCCRRSAFSQCFAAWSARRSVSCLLVMMRRNLGLKGFPLHFFLTDAPCESLFFLLASGLHLQLTVPAHSDWLTAQTEAIHWAETAGILKFDWHFVLTWSLKVFCFLPLLHVLFLLLCSSFHFIFSVCLQ